MSTCYNVYTHLIVSCDYHVTIPLSNRSVSLVTSSNGVSPSLLRQLTLNMLLPD